MKNRKLLRAMVRAGSVTRSELSRRLGVNHQRICQIVNGHEPKVLLALRIARELDTTVEEIFG